MRPPSSKHDHATASWLDDRRLRDRRDGGRLHGAAHRRLPRPCDDHPAQGPASGVRAGQGVARRRLRLGLGGQGRGRRPRRDARRADHLDRTAGRPRRRRHVRGGPGRGHGHQAGPAPGGGEPAINPVPRRMMAEHIAAIGGHGDVVVEISVEHGEELARRTWNPRLGILGGLSILGTTGIVVPYSCSAWIDSIRRGVDVAIAAGRTHVAGCTGSTSERVAAELYGLPDDALLDMGDFAGAVLKYLRRHPVPRLTIAGGVGKLSKLADGHLDLHSGRSQVNLGLLAGLVAAPELAERIRGANTALHALRLAEEAGEPLGDLVAERAHATAAGVLRGAPVEVDVVVIDRAGTIVGRHG
ncbi:cobalt-precorrin-5B (C(1))-methyltransferase CbiD [Nonomuraea recticatena]|uniref:cobalt-precorrin-5B (C(1))-methyltransferase CbiD n=1 Tax=Nonomuraea recticatena TaxID=46178 RepID=UPI0036198477